MAGKYLGDEFDIHGGGFDLRSRTTRTSWPSPTAAGQRFARYWMHNAWVTAAGEKMSKSLGNGALVCEVIQRYPARAVRLLPGPAALPLGDRVLRHLAGRGDRGPGPDRQLRGPGPSSWSAEPPPGPRRPLRDRDGRRPRHPGRGGRALPGGPGRQHRARRGRHGDGRRAAGRGAGHAGRCSVWTPRTRSGSTGGDAPVWPRSSTVWSPSCWSSGRRPGSGATSPRPTPSAMPSVRPGHHHHRHPRRTALVPGPHRRTHDHDREGR